MNIRLKEDNTFSLFSRKEWSRTYLFGRNSLYGDGLWFILVSKNIIDLFLLRCIKAEIKDNDLEIEFKKVTENTY